MFGDMKEKQAAMQKKLAEIQLISEAAEGKIKIMANFTCRSNIWSFSLKYSWAVPFALLM